MPWRRRYSSTRRPLLTWRGEFIIAVLVLAVAFVLASAWLGGQP